MERLSRRTVVLGATGLAGASLTGSSLLGASYATFPRIQFFLDKPSYQLGQKMTLKLKEEVRRPLRVRVKDSSGTVWSKVLKSDRKHVWRATADRPGTGVVTIIMRRSDGRVFRRAVAYTVAGTTPQPAPTTLVGMSAPTDAWDGGRLRSAPASRPAASTPTWPTAT